MFLCTLLQLAPLLQPAVSVQPASYSLLMLQTASVGTFGGNFQDDPQGLKLKHSRKVGVRVWGGRARGRGGLGLKVMGRGMHYSPPAPPPPLPGFTLHPSLIPVTYALAYPRPPPLCQGLLSMANGGPNTNGGHFSTIMGPAHHLDGSYTIFGEVVTGYEVRWVGGL